MATTHYILGLSMGVAGRCLDPVSVHATLVEMRERME